ncbi:MAG: amino acid adenylation domain-containing protein [Chloroflexota bacterium]
MTLFMTLLAAFQTLLYRYSGEVDLVTGTPVANRNRLEVEGLIGFFVNTLVLRTNLAGNPTFRELLGRVREVALGAYSHQDLPFELLVEALQPERHLDRNPLFQVMFAFQPDMPLTELRLAGLSVRPVEVESNTAGFDLTLTIEETTAGLKSTWEYSTDLFEPETIERMADHYHTLLTGIVAQPEQRLSELPLLTEAERQQLLVTWNQTEADYPVDLCLPHLFEAQAARTPEAVAVIFEETTLTFAELNRRANQLAHYLHRLGVGPEVLVGICIERSVEMIVGLLGILKAGGAYVPLDPTYPPERLAFMLQDAQVSVLLTQQKLVDALPPHQAQVIRLDSDWKLVAPAGELNPVCQTTPDNLAYVIYTSGSTGKPKGVMIPHRGLVNYLVWCSRTYDVESGNGAPLHSSISFDLTITGLFAPLLSGRPVHLLPNDGGIDALAAALRNGPTFSLVKLTPAHLELLSRQLSPSEAAGCAHRFIIGGENLVTESITFWQEAAPETILVNEYGPTETVVGCCVYQVPANLRKPGSVPIGRPIANTRLYLLDEYLQPVPIGVVGELYIGGAGVARGYLNRPELTAERFIPNPFDTQAEARLYKTGDLARYLPDSNLEFLGRIDQQVKLRGFRIELGEIETVLGQHPAVREAVVLLREDHPGDKRLVAYVLPEQPAEINGSDLQDYLRQKLPDYMVPGVYVTLETLPLTPNGKVNRQALPAPHPAAFNLKKEFVSPQDELELQLAQIWEQILDVRPISVTDNFFDLGGHSLLAVRMFARIKEILGQNLPVATLFQAPTVAALADILRRKGWTGSWSSLVPIQSGGARPPFFCIHGMGGGVLDYAPLAQHLGSDQPFYGLQERGFDGLSEPFSRIEAMAAYYIEEIRAFQPSGPYFLGGYCFGGTIAFEIARQLQAQGHKVGLLAIIDNTPPNLDLRPTVWSPTFMAGFLKNLLPWLYDFFQLGPAQMLARIQRKVRVVSQRFGKGSSSPNNEPTQADIESIIDNDISQIPAEHHKFLQAHYRALIAYTPPPYPGRITLFRTRGQSLSGPFDPDLGWGKLAAGVETHNLSGFHANILQEPYVQMLAKQLKICLDKAQSDDSDELA